MMKDSTSQKEKLRLYLILVLAGILSLPLCLFSIAPAFGGKTDDFASSVVQTSDGGYVIAGTTNSHDYGIGDTWLIKVSGEPDRIDDKTLADDPALTARTEIVAGFGATLAITILLAVYIIRRKRQ